MAEIYLRPLTVEDSATSYKWRNDVDLWKYTGRRPDIVVTEEIERDWAKRVIADPTRANFAICTVDGRYIGNIYLVNIHGKTGELGIFIGDKGCRGHGYGALAVEALKILVQQERGVSTIMIDVAEDNVAALKTYEKCGAVRTDGRRVLPAGRIWMRIDLLDNLMRVKC